MKKSDEDLAGLTAEVSCGFEDIVIVDGDKVELSNHNRQNYEKGI